MVNQDLTKDKKAKLPLIPKKILIVVPDPETKQGICNSLSSAGYKVHSVKNAEEGLAFLSEIIPDLIIFDIDMSDLTGIEFCIKVRQNIQTAAVPLILLSDSQKFSNRFGSLKLGADDYISKPIDLTELIPKVEDKLERFSGLRKLINLDAFTNLFNRDFFDWTLKEIIKLSSRYRHKFSLVLFDIDYFKTFNDTYGHQIGDYALKEVAKMIKKGLREVDTVARYGDDEFVAILPETSKRDALIAIERIKKELAQKSFQFEEIPSGLHITISAGVATYPEDAQTDYELINKADLALYAEKKKR